MNIFKSQLKLFNFHECIQKALENKSSQNSKNTKKSNKVSIKII